MDNFHKLNSNTTKKRWDCKPFIVFVLNFPNKSKKKHRLLLKFRIIGKATLQVAFIQQLNRLRSLSKLCLEQSMLSGKRIFAFYQRYFCLLSNVNMITIKYSLSQRKTLHSSIFYPQKILECRVMGFTSSNVVAKVCYLIRDIMY